MLMVNEQVNREYSPSLWSKRLSEDDIEHHISFIHSVSENIKSEIPFIHDVRFGNKSTNLDVYGVDLEQGAPIFVYIHDGYWQMLSKSESNYVVRPLWKSKIKACIPEYDSAKRSVWFGGHSAGAHLAASLLNEHWLESLPPNSRALSLSPLHNVKHLVHRSLLNEYFKILVAVAQYDSAAFIEQGILYYEKLKKANANVQYRMLPDVDHFDIVERLNDESYVLTQEIISLITAN